MFFSDGRSEKYLEYIISSEGISTDREKIVAITNWPIPRNKKHSAKLFGFMFLLSKFVKGFSSFAKSLYRLTENQARFVWDKQCNDSFNELWLALSSFPILSFLRGEGRFILDTDVSSYRIGAVLS